VLLLAVMAVMAVLVVLAVLAVDLRFDKGSQAFAA
jgi:hypothetical protein